MQGDKQRQRILKTYVKHEFSEGKKTKESKTDLSFSLQWCKYFSAKMMPENYTCLLKIKI